MRNRRPGPFSVNVRDIVRRPGEMREHTFGVAVADSWGEGLVSFAEGSEVGVDVRLESMHEGILASGTATGLATGVCGRCLIDISIPSEVEFQELFAYPGEEANDFEVDDERVDLETLVRDALVLSLSFQPVCRPDCPGLDPVTGERLADHPRTTEPEPSDPRWAALAEFGSKSADDAAGDGTI